ncbi:arginine--tRNA ligase [candidate division WOR-3 bacterium]|nr:arginine--tRNA ligase [candidate division WOR-3 bacterium]
MIRSALISLLQGLFPSETIVVDHVPKDKQGDYATNIAFKIAAQQKKQPLQVAKEIAARISDPMIEHITVQEPAFINFTIARDYILKALFEKPNALDIGHGAKVLVEFVSANPTGPLNIVSARAAAVGDSLVRLLNHTGFKAHAEYYVNDGGRQAALLAESVKQRMIEFEGGTPVLPEDGYHGTYIVDVARAAKEQGIVSDEDVRSFSIAYFVENHKKALLEFGVRFNTWICESSICEKGSVEKVLAYLRKRDLVYEKDNALWLKTQQFGDKDDRVLVTSDGRYTYLLPDIAYHLDKIERGYAQLIDILGPDHQAQAKSMQSSLQAMDKPAGILKVIIIQQVNLKKDGQILKMSKRAGVLETMEDLLKQVPKDVVRFFLLMRSNSQHLDFDLDLAQQQSDENPVYYVQYAHARIYSILDHVREQGMTLSEDFDPKRISETEELDLAKILLRFPEVLEDAVHHLEPYMLTYYLLDVARTFHYFYQKQRVVDENEPELTYARLALVKKTARVIKDGLTILGVSCPEKM